MSIVGFAVFIGAGSFASWWMWQHPIVDITNDLVQPIDVEVDGALTTVSASSTQRVKLRHRAIPPLPWRVSAASDFATRSLGGESLDGTAQPTLGNLPWQPGTVHIRARDGDHARFAPLITNASNQPLHIRVNAELASSNGAPLTRDCTCLLAPGVTRQFIGYYRLFANSNVRAITAAGDSATFENLGGSVDGSSGQLRLRFTDADFRHP